MLFKYFLKAVKAGLPNVTGLVLRSSMQHVLERLYHAFFKWETYILYIGLNVSAIYVSFSVELYTYEPWTLSQLKTTRKIVTVICNT